MTANENAEIGRIHGTSRVAASVLGKLFYRPFIQRTIVSQQLLALNRSYSAPG
jgi:hypothetical protein